MKVYGFEFNPLREKTYVIFDMLNEAGIIDCGAYFPEEKNRLQEFIQERKLYLARLLNTHLHVDHTLGNHFIYDEYDLLPEYHREEDTLPSQKEQAKMLDIPLKDSLLHAKKHIEDGEVIAVGECRLTALWIPGHSPGSLCFYSKINNCVFTGDVLFRESVGRSDLWGGDHEQLIAGIKEKLLCYPDHTIVYPGHGSMTTIGHERAYNPYLK